MIKIYVSSNQCSDLFYITNQLFRREDPEPKPKRDGAKSFSCPKCSRTFPILQLLQNHVNDCLDRP